MKAYKIITRNSIFFQIGFEKIFVFSNSHSHAEDIRNANAQKIYRSLSIELDCKALNAYKINLFYNNQYELFNRFCSFFLLGFLSSFLSIALVSAAAAAAAVVCRSNELFYGWIVKMCFAWHVFIKCMSVSWHIAKRVEITIWQISKLIYGSLL